MLITFYFNYFFLNDDKYFMFQIVVKFNDVYLNGSKRTIK